MYPVIGLIARTHNLTTYRPGWQHQRHGHDDGVTEEKDY